MVESEKIHIPMPVHGYTLQKDENIKLVNRNKEIEKRVLRILDELRLMPSVDPRWLQAGRTGIEKGFMSVNRAIFNPARFNIPVLESDNGQKEIDKDNKG